MVRKRAQEYLQEIRPLLKKHFGCLTRLCNLENSAQLSAEMQETIESLEPDVISLADLIHLFTEQCRRDIPATKFLAGRCQDKLTSCLFMNWVVQNRTDLTLVLPDVRISGYLIKGNLCFSQLRKQLIESLPDYPPQAYPGSGTWSGTPFQQRPTGTAAFGLCMPQGIPRCPEEVSSTPPGPLPWHVPLGVFSSQASEDDKSVASAAGENRGPFLLPEEDSFRSGADDARLEKVQNEPHLCLSKSTEEHFSKEIIETLTRIENHLKTFPGNSKEKGKRVNTFKERLYLLLKAGAHQHLLKENGTKKDVYAILAKSCGGNATDCAKYVRCFISEEEEINGIAAPQTAFSGKKERDPKYSMRGLYPEVDKFFEGIKKKS